MRAVLIQLNKPNLSITCTHLLGIPSQRLVHTNISNLICCCRLWPSLYDHSATTVQLRKAGFLWLLRELWSCCCLCVRTLQRSESEKQQMEENLHILSVCPLVGALCSKHLRGKDLTKIPVMECEHVLWLLQESLFALNQLQQWVV